MLDSLASSPSAQDRAPLKLAPIRRLAKVRHPTRTGQRAASLHEVLVQKTKTYSRNCQTLRVLQQSWRVSHSTKGKLPLVPKNKDGQPLKSRVEALADPRHDTPDLLPPGGTMDKDSVATTTGKGAAREIKEWQAIMDHLRRLPVKKGELPVIPVDDRAKEVRAIKAG
jgi:hypothetical protein